MNKMIRNNLLLPILILMVILPRLATDLYIPSLPSISYSFNGSIKMVQMTMTMFMLGYAISMLIAGTLSDIYGRKKVMIWGIGVFLISTLICAISNSLIILVTARFFQAIGGCSGTVVARVMVRDSYKKDHQISILSHLSTAMAICPLIAPVIGGIINTYFGWHYIFIVLLLIGLITLALILKELEEESVVTKRDILISDLFKNYKMLLTDKSFLGYSFTIGTAWSAYFAFVIEAPFLFQKELGLSSISFGILFSVVVLGYVIGAQLSRKYANKIGWDQLILIAIFFCVVGSVILCLLILLLKLCPAIVVFPMILIMIGVGIIIPCTQAAVMQPFLKITGTASGLFFFIQMIFGLISGLVIQSFTLNPSKLMAFVILFSSLFLFSSFHFLIWRNKQKI
jgi:DHA1 family bicyclomycin/chloramphenicol resistance-like MFS transporter